MGRRAKISCAILFFTVDIWYFNDRLSAPEPPRVQTEYVQDNLDHIRYMSMSEKFRQEKICKKLRFCGQERSVSPPFPLFIRSTKTGGT